MRHLIPALAVLAGTVCAAPAEDVLQLRDGTSVNGKVASVTVDAQGRQTTYPRDQVASVTIGGGAGAAAPAPAPAPAPPAAKTAGGSSSGAVPSGGMPSIPAGTALLVRTKDAIDSRKNGAGARFEAALESDLSVGGTVIAPKGTPVFGEVRSAQQAGNLFGKSELEIGLTGIQLGGKLSPCATDAATASGQSQGRDTARKTGAGALIGAAADGSEGARKGAAVGGAVSLLTRGSSVQIPSGTLLEFRLTQPFAP
jgi:hypothetical protein